jgi:hypothetical protein
LNRKLSEPLDPFELFGKEKLYCPVFKQTIPHKETTVVAKVSK